MKYVNYVFLGSTIVTFSSACSEDTTRLLAEEEAPGGENRLTAARGGGAPTFYEHMAPIFSAKCVACHQEGGIAPFALTDYDAARSRARQIADYTEARVMPPFGIDTGGDCGSFDASMTLTDAEIALIGLWANGERAEGTKVALEVPDLPALDGGTEFVLPEFEPVIDGGPLSLFDEYRCFLVDLGQDSLSFVTGYDVQPGHAQLVHHVIGYIVDPTQVTDDGRVNAEVMQELHASDPDPARQGWSCFGSAGEGVAVESVPVTWGPGQGVVNYPSGVGVPVVPGRKLVVQVHYNLAGDVAAGAMDQTRVRMRLVPTVQRQAVFLLEDPLLGSLFGASPEVLPAGRESVTYTWVRSGAQLGLPAGVPAELLSLAPHMHERGHKYMFEIDDGGGFECAGRVDDWDFNWQRIYNYTLPLAFDADTRVRVTCDFDTSRDDEDVLPGWGTRNEMCLATMIIALPAAP